MTDTTSPSTGPTHPGPDLDPGTATLHRYLERADRLRTALDGVGGAWDAPTPCPGWTVADVVDHVIDTERDFLGRHGLLPTSDLERADHVLAWRDHLATVAEVFSRPGVAATRFDGYFGPTTLGETLADFYGWDVLVHGWDVARATGQRYDLPADEIAWMEAVADGWGEALRMDGVCGPAVPVGEDAPAQHRLLGRLGRDPHWTA